MQVVILCLFLVLRGTVAVNFNIPYDPSAAENFWRNAQARMENYGRMVASQLTNFQQQTQHTVNEFGQKFDDTVHHAEGEITSVIDHAMGQRGPETRSNDPFLVVDVPAQRSKPVENPHPFQPQFPQLQFPFHGSNFMGFPASRSNVDLWWNGPNVCIERQEIDEPVNNTSRLPISFHSTQCVIMEETRTCTTHFQAHGIRKTFVITYQCCHGYHRHTSHGLCEGVEMKPMMDTIRSVGGTLFADLITFTGLGDKFGGENLTVFCPSDEALKTFRDDFEENAVLVRPVRRRSVDNNDLVLTHAIPGFLRTSDFVDERILLTENKEASVRTNVYNIPDKVMTVNCIRVNAGNKYATNGVVHLIDEVIQPVTKSLGDIIKSDRQFTILKKLINHALLEKTLEGDGQLTLFAPTDDAFRQIDPILLRKLLSGEACATSIIKYHILPNVVCAGILPNKARSVTLLGSDVRLHRHDDDKFFVNDKEIIQNDQMATNGVMHVINGVLIPEEANSIGGVLDEWQLTDLIDLLEDADVLSSLNDMKNITFFAPSNDAVKKASPILNELRKSPGKLHDVMMYHIGHPTMTVCQIDNNQQITTSLGSKSIRFNHFYSMSFGLSSQVTVQCARILEMDKKACGASIQLVDKLLMPPEGHLVDILSSNQTFSIMRKLLRESNLERELAEHGPYTVLAPTDQAFYSLPEEKLTSIMKDKNQINDILRTHILPEVLCCAGVQQAHWFYYQKAQTLSGSPLSLGRHHHSIVVGPAHIVTCDIMADNGVVHAIDQVITPHEPQKTTYIYQEPLYLYN